MLIFSFLFTPDYDNEVTVSDYDIEVIIHDYDIEVKERTRIQQTVLCLGKVFKYRYNFELTDKKGNVFTAEKELLL